MVGWRKALSKSNPKSEKEIFISVIVPFRNEGEGIRNAIQSLIEQDYGKHNFEVILVDDHSSDDSRQQAKWATKGYESFVVLPLADGEGKKRAIQFGIACARGEIIALTDADCQVSPNWLSTVRASFVKSNVMMSFGLVRVDGRGFWNELQQIEFSSIMGVTLSGWGRGQPVMCNGANLAYKKEAFTAVNGFDGNWNVASGDDEFLLRKILAHNGANAVDFHTSTVTTHTQRNVFDFFRQRLRWASKWSSNTSLVAIIFAVFIFVVQLFWLVLVWQATMAGNSHLLVMVLIKLVLEFSWLYRVTKHLKSNFNFFAFLSLQILYAPYVVFVGIFSSFVSTQWKGRSTREKH